MCRLVLRAPLGAAINKCFSVWEDESEKMERNFQYFIPLRGSFAGKIPSSLLILHITARNVDKQ